MKTRTKILIIIIIILIIGGYFGYKAFNLLIRYNLDNMSDVIQDLKINSSIKLDYDKKLEDNQEYLEFKNIKIRNDFKNFEYLEDVSTEDSIKYALYDNDKNLNVAVMIGMGSTYIEMLKSDMDIFSNDGKLISDYDLREIEIFLKENDINNDIQLFEYIIEHKKDKSNIFTSIEKMKEKYILYYIMDVMLPSVYEISIIDGMYVGYIFNLSNGLKEVSILYNDERYGFTFIGEDYFTDDYIYELLNTIVIESSINEMEDEAITFTRTYSIVDVVENNSLEYDSFEIKQFQDEETVVVDIKKELAALLSKNKNYEFTFQRTNQNNIEDNIKSIFENTELIQVVETEREGLEQIQEAFNK